MEQSHHSLAKLQDTLRSLELRPKGEHEYTGSERILLGKILATRVFRRFTISEITLKTCRLKTKTQIDKISYNVFKFTFGSKEEKDEIFRERPWSLKGAHLILKEWLANLSLKEVLSETSTFMIQVHGLLSVC